MMVRALLLTVSSFLVVLPVAASCGEDHGDEGPCCFTNQRYAGVCEEVPEGEETCASILEYLNNPRSVGKGYCGNTDLRGGWIRVSCDDEEGEATLAVDDRQLRH